MFCISIFDIVEAFIGLGHVVFYYHTSENFSTLKINYSCYLIFCYYYLCFGIDFDGCLFKLHMCEKNIMLEIYSDYLIISQEWYQSSRYHC